MAQLTKTVHTAWLGLEFKCLFMFLGCMIYLYIIGMFCFTLVSWVISLYVLALA